jgi:hypothetical protein
MLEKLVNYVEELFIEITSIEQGLKTSGLKREDALDFARRACSITKNPCSLYNIIYDLYRLSGEKVNNSKELAMRISLLIVKYNFQTDFQIVRIDKNEPFANLVDSVSYALPNEKKVFTNDYLNEVTNINCINSVKSLVILGKKYISIAKEEIQINIFKFIALKSRVLESENSNEITPYEKEYLDSWINNTIEYRNLSHNCFYDLDALIENQKLSPQIIEQIDKKRNKLFKEGLKRKLKSLKDDLKEIREEKRKQTILTHKTLIDKFLAGDLSNILIDRINIFIQLRNPDKVILEYDNLLRTDYTSSFDLNVFTPKLFRHYSPTFTAHLIFEYLIHLNYLLHQNSSEPIKSSSSKILKQTNGRSKNTVTPIENRLSFKFKGDIEKLSGTLKTLFFQIDLLSDENQINYLIDLLTSEDLSEFSEPIHINCETKQFGYLISGFRFYFLNLTPTTIEKSKLFNSKKGTPLTATNLYLKGSTPKRAEIINNTLNKMK